MTSDNPTKNESLPELPPTAGFIARPAFGPDGFSKSQGVSTEDAYTADQMRAYAEAALTREAPTEAVMYDRALIAGMLDNMHNGDNAYYRREKVDKQIQLLLAANGSTGSYDCAACDGTGRAGGDGSPIPCEDCDARGVIDATPPAPQRLAQGYGKIGPRISVFSAAADPTPRKFDPVQAAEELGITQPPHHDRGGVWPAVDRLLAAAFTAGLNGDEFDMLDARAKFLAALTEAKQQGPGEAVHQYQFRNGKSPAWYDEGTGPTPDAWHHDCVQPDHLWRTLYTAPQVEAKRQTGEGE